MKNIFSVGIEIYKIENIDNEKIVDYSRKYSIKNGIKDTQSILTNNIFYDLNNLVESKMKNYFHKIYNNKYDISLARAWANYNADEFNTVPHVHKEYFLSAVYYPLATDGSLTFMNPMPSLLAHQGDDMIDQYNEYNSDYYEFYARTGHLIIFNSMLNHYIEKTKQERVSIGYDGYLIKI